MKVIADHIDSILCVIVVLLCALALFWPRNLGRRGRD